MNLELYVFPASPRAFKVLVVANHLGLQYESRLVHLFKGDQNDPGYVTLNPNRRMPVLKEGNFVLWESNAIVQYLATKQPESNLLPMAPEMHARVSQWLCWDLAHWGPALGLLIDENVKKPFAGAMPDPAQIQTGERLFDSCAKVLDGCLREHAFVAGDQLTVADFCLASWLNDARLAKYPPLDRYPGIARWYATLRELPAWQRTLTEREQFLTQLLGGRARGEGS